MAGGLTHSRKARIEIPAASIVGTGTDYALPILLTADVLRKGGGATEMLDADGANPAQNGGGDIRVTSDESGTTALPIEVVGFVTDNDPALGQAEIWVRNPGIDRAAGGAIWIWWGTAGASEQPAVTDPIGRNAVWQPEYMLVWHGNAAGINSTGTTPLVEAAPGGVISVSPLGGDAQTAPRWRAQDAAVGNLAGTDPVTVQSWLNGTGDGTMVSRRDGGSASYQWFQQAGGITFRVAGNFPLLSTPIPGGWRSEAITYLGGAGPERLYRDGVLVATGTQNLQFPSFPAIPLRIGHRGQDGTTTVAFAYDGAQTEVRVRDSILTADDIATEYANQSAPLTFFGTVGPAEAAGGGGLTAVGRERASTWDVAALAGAQGAAAWGVAALAGRAGVASWSVAALAAGEAASAWDIRAPVGQSVAGTWSLAAVAGRDAAAGWDVATSIGRAAAAGWDVLALAGGEAVAGYGIAALAGREISASWDIAAALGTAGASRAAVWDIAQTGGASVAPAWDIAELAGATAVPAWDVLSRAGGELALAWDIRSLAAADLASDWAVKQIAGASAVAAWVLGTHDGVLVPASRTIRIPPQSRAIAAPPPARALRFSPPDRAIRSI